MKHLIFKFEITALVLACSTSAGIADINPPGWTGAAKTCSGGNELWSDEDNWTNCGTNLCPPTSGNVHITARVVCGDPCDIGACLFLCFPFPCVQVCQGGPFHTESCTVDEDCFCAGGTYTVDYNYTSNNTFAAVTILADSNNITLKKTTSDNAVMEMTGLFSMRAESGKTVTLDLQASGINPNDVDAFGIVDIQGNSIMNVDGGFRAKVWGENTVLTVKGNGTINVTGTGTTLVQASSTYTAKLTLENTTFDPASLKVYGGPPDDPPDDDKLATFLQMQDGRLTATAGKQFDWVAMRGNSLIQCDRTEQSYVLGTDLTVDTNGAETFARIQMPSGNFFQADNIFITAASTYKATLKLTGGQLICDGLVTITGVSGAAAELEIQFSGVSTLLTNVTLNTEGFLDLEQDTTLSGELKLLKDSTAGSELQVATGRTLTVGTLFIKGGVKYDPDLPGTAKIVTN